MLAYRVLRRFLRLVARIFFRHVEVVGLEHVPVEGAGPVIFVGNHPNSLIDPVMMIAFAGRIMHFAAKDVLFKSRLLRFFLRILGAVPVARRADYAGEAVQNELAFEAMFKVLGEGRAVGIFPEGLSHDGAQLARLKTGAARIALGAARACGGLLVRIVPCGLTYVRRKRFRNRVLIQFGAPIVITPERLAACAGDEATTVRELTAEIEAAMRALTVNADDWETVRVLDGVRRLYQPEHISIADRIELQRRFNSVFPTIRAEPDAAALFARVANYLERLRALGLSDRDLRGRVAPGDALLRIAHHFMLLLVWVPLALPGALLNAPVGLLAVWAGQNLTPRKDVVATTKLVAGVLGSLVVYVALVGAIVVTWGLLVAGVAAALIPVTGYATLRVLDRGRLVVRWFATLGRLFRLRAEMEALRAERAELEEAVVRAVDRFRPREMEPLFPRAPREGPPA